jgi:hypothetical protein
MWTIKPSGPQAERMQQTLTNIRWAIQQMQSYPPLQGEVSTAGLERLINDLEYLLKMNDRLMACFAVEAGVMSEGQAARYLGLDRVTFREIKEAARVWAERSAGAGKGTETTDGDTAGRAPGGGAGEPTQAGVAGDGPGVGGAEQAAGASTA